MSRQPLDAWRWGGIKVAAWKNRKKSKTGGEYTDVNFSFSNSYKKDQEWVELKSYSAEDALKLAALLQQAINKYPMLKELVSQDTGGDSSPLETNQSQPDFADDDIPF